MKNLILLAAILAYSLSVWNCSNQSLAGGTSEQGNAFTVAGRITNKAGSGQAKVAVTLRLNAYVPGLNTIPSDTLLAMTDANGKFGFTTVDSGQYTISAIDSGAIRKGLRKAISLKGETIIPDLIIDSSGIVQVTLPDSGKSYLVFVPGTELFTKAAPGDTVRLSVPAGTVDIVVREISAATNAHVTPDGIYANVPVESGTLIIPSLVPDEPQGPDTGIVNIGYAFKIKLIISSLPSVGSPGVEYRFNFGDGDTTAWLQDTTFTASHSWAAAGEYGLRAQMRIHQNNTAAASAKITLTAWSQPHIISILK